MASAVPRIVAGGTPTFPIHALDKHVECSPERASSGCATAQNVRTWISERGAGLDSRRQQAGREPSLPRSRHKAIASENPHPRSCF